MAIKLDVNPRVHQVDVPDDKPLLRVLREDVGLTRTRFGRGIAINPDVIRAQMQGAIGYALPTGDRLNA